MKNQNDLIIVVVSLVLALIALGVLWGTKPSIGNGRDAPPTIPKVVTSEPQLPTSASVKMAAALPNAPTGGGGGGATAGGRPAAGGTPGAGGMTVGIQGASQAR